MSNPAHITRRTLLAASALLALPAFAQRFPAKPITLICPFSPGGTADTQLRVLAAGASKELGQQVIVDNRAGVAGTLGPASLIGASPDGYTLSLATAIALLRQPFIQKTRYDPAKHFTYLIGVTRFEIGLAVRADSPWATFDDFVKDAKRNPGKVSYGTAGNATAQHTAMLQLAERLGIDWTHIPYKGSGEVFNALSGGHVQAISETSGWAPFVDAGKFRLLAVFSESRLKRWPNVPTLKELGYGITESIPWGIVGPAGMESSLVKVLHDAFRKAIDDPAFTKLLATLGQEPWAVDSQAYHDYTMSRIPIERDLVAKYRLREQ
jgi:tripartite-type tricarboxylate transporter receptor subunit TctC